MVRSAEATLRQQKRAERRREQVINAARVCVRSGGFHAASMSQIAAEAGMSVGHIYQYFDNKDAIIRELSQSDFDEFMLRITELNLASSYTIDDVVSTMVSKAAWLLDIDRAAISREVFAEAPRNPRVAEILKHFNSRFREIVRAIVGPLLKDLAPSDVDMRIEMMLVLTQALPLHAGMHPSGNDEILIAGYEYSLRSMLRKPLHIVTV